MTISDTTFAFMRDEAAIAGEAALGGFYVLRTSDLAAAASPP
jgi:hypothetical protein